CSTPRGRTGRPPVTETPDEPLLRTDRLTRHFKVGGIVSRRTLHAVDDVSLAIGAREIVALAGESGSRRSPIARLLAHIPPPTSVHVYLRGRPPSSIRSRAGLLRYRGEVPVVFQDPFSATNPVFRASHGILRALTLHRPELSRQQRYEEAERAFEAVGLSPAAEIMQRYPHELSGGPRQRVGFARGPALRPKPGPAARPACRPDAV